MRAKVGLWIDHRKAIIVAITDKGEPLRGPYESQKVPASDSRQKKLTGLRNIYYDAIISCIRDADSILIFGPGEAKGELKKRLERDKLGGHIVGIKTIDKMTDRQIAAKVRQYFAQ
jgi:hypothetical protein